MAASGFAILASTLLLLCTPTFASTLQSTKEHFVRRERSSTVRLTPERLSPEAKEVDGTKGCTVCQKKDYLLGKEKTKDTCRHPGNETRVGADEGACLFAAARTGAHVDALNIFRVDDADDKKRYPYGCFYKKCVPHVQKDDADAPEVDCFFYNLGDESEVNESRADFEGTPVCQREKFEDGTEGQQGGCPSDEYKVIDHDDQCRKMCDFGGYAGCDDQDFDLDDAGNYTVHHDFPQGCFHQKLDQQGAMTTVFWNSVSSGTTVTGTPICIVASPLQLVNASTVASTAASAGTGGTGGTGTTL